MLDYAKHEFATTKDAIAMPFKAKFNGEAWSQESFYFASRDTGLINSYTPAENLYFHSLLSYYYY